MKVLFVASGNNKTGIMAPFVESQAESLRRKGLEVHYSLVIGHGLISYLRYAKKIRSDVRMNGIDVIHAHYSLCALSSLLAFTGKPIVASYMGSDAYGSIGKNGKTKPRSYWLVIISLIIQPFLSYIICKSDSISKFVYIKRSSIIPNGVDLSSFPVRKRSIIPETEPFRILFLGNPNDQRKNFALVKEAVSLLGHENIEVISPYPIDRSEVPSLLSHSDMLALSSLEEGSPNVVKEAMACCLPIVATNAGDAWWLLGDIPGHYKASFDAVSFAKGIKTIMEFKSITDGRQRLIELGLDADMVADKIIDVYKKVIRRKH